MELSRKKTFTISIYGGCTLYGKLKLDKENKGYLKYYYDGKEITIDLDNYNHRIVESIIRQATSICEMKYGVLWSY